jgi:hypothetical protein
MRRDQAPQFRRGAFPVCSGTLCPMEAARCPRHPNSADVKVCPRCGSFFCGDCFQTDPRGFQCPDCAGREERAAPLLQARRLIRIAGVVLAAPSIAAGVGAGFQVMRFPNAIPWPFRIGAAVVIASGACAGFYAGLRASIVGAWLAAGWSGFWIAVNVAIMAKLGQVLPLALGVIWAPTTLGVALLIVGHRRLHTATARSGASR